MTSSEKRGWRRTRIGRRPFVGAGLAGGAALVAACSSSTTSKPVATATVASQGTGAAPSTAAARPASASPAARQPKRGGSFRYVDLNTQPTDPATFQPFPLFYTVYEGLAVWKGSEQKASPHLATSWEQPDASTIIFHLDPTAHWQSKAPLGGRKLTSQDVKFSLDYINSPDPKFQFKSDFASLDLKRTETPNDATITLHTSAPFSPQLTILLTSFRLLVLPHEVVERDGSLEKASIGSGPFLVDQYVQNGNVHLVRNPDYWKPGLPYIDEVQDIFINDTAAQLSAFTTGNLELLTKRTFDQLTGFPKTAQILKVEAYQWSGLRFNVTRKPFDDVRVRQAISMAIDRDALNQIVYNGSSAPAAAVTRVYGKFALPQDELRKQPGYRTPKDQDIADAKKLLDAAAVKDLAVTVVGSNGNVPLTKTPAEAIVDQLAKIGVKVTPDIQDNANYNRVRTGGDFALLSEAQLGTGDPDTVVRQSVYSSSSRNYGHYNNPQVDALIDKQAAEVDEGKRVQIIYDIQRLLLTEAPVAMYMGHIDITAIQPYVQGLADWQSPSTMSYTHGFGQTVWLDK